MSAQTNVLSEPERAEVPAVNAGAVRVKPKNKLVRRTDVDYSQKLRRGVQIAFLLLNVWIGVQFYIFVRYFESGGRTMSVSRPPGVEGWLPIAALMNLKATLLTGQLPALHASGMFLLIAFLAISLLLRKAFCSWLCPVGTVSEYLWRLGKKIFRRNFRLPRGVDIPLRGLKYLLLSLFLYAVVSMPVQGIIEFLHGPYGLIADVKMLNFFRFMGTTAILVIALLVVASLFVQNFWCRYLCPYGALMGLAALFSPVRIRRDEPACIDCAKCAKACPAALPVDKLITIKSAECAACMECVAVCPAEGALNLTTVLPRKRVPAWAVAAVIAALFLGIVGWAQATGHWESDIPARIYFDLVPRAHELSHP
ncbi:MAG TPA: 4Fe-4S binding protein [Terriglobales bacterium]|nr:4Fe-4S binding protein [Terriglobales bacterium]